MKIGRIRYLLVFFAAVFFANNVAAAVRSCVAELAGQEHAAIQAADATGDEHLCPMADDAARCLAHCTQSYKNDEQQFWINVPGAVFAPALSVPRIWFQPAPAVSLVALTLPSGGPSLTILFLNLRI